MRENTTINWRLLIAAGLFLGALFVGGCESANPQESQLPWARPASWEGGAPGMGGGGLNQGRNGY
ncbi:MAG: hypothetical protein ACQKBV_03990 [Puniceicoccales bacterium]